MKMKKAIFFLSVFLSYVPVLAQVDTAWVRRYNGPGNDDDEATALSIDDSGDIYVTGYSWSGTSFDYTTIKYSPNGDTLWVRRYDGPGNTYDVAASITVDKMGNVYVTGYSWSGTSIDYATIKYAPNGDTLWVRRYDKPSNSDDRASALALDNGGNVYVTGNSGTIKYLADGSFSWVRSYGVAGTALAVDDSGNVYVAGIIGAFPNFDFATMKYAPNGDTLWLRRYNGPLNNDDRAFALAVDSNGNVHVGGYSLGETFYDYATVKYTPKGDTLWVTRYNGSGNGYDRVYALAVDVSGNVYVTGISEDDYATIKYSADGDSLWIRRYNGPGNSTDIARALAVDNDGNVYVTGKSWSMNSYLDYATIKYASNGDVLWVRRFNGPDKGNDEANAIAVDGGGNVYVTGNITDSGFSYYDYATIKYVQFACIAISGDADSDNNVLFPDIITIINFLFKSHPAPNPSCRADANADGNVLLTDIIYLINFIFKSGPAPQKSRECC